jgi:hypothetical protein
MTLHEIVAPWISTEKIARVICGSCGMGVRIAIALPRAGVPLAVNYRENKSAAH